MADASIREERFLVRLEGRSCKYCEAGTLERETYEGNDALVCESCGTPQAQIW